MDSLWPVSPFIHNFFAKIWFLLWTYLVWRVTIHLVRESAEVLFDAGSARLRGWKVVRGGATRRRGFRGRCGPSGSAGLGLVPAMARRDAFGCARKIEGTAGHVRATAVLLPERL